MGRHSNFLYADPSFVEGMARLLDIGDTLTEYNRSTSTEQADAIAIGNDWQAVYEDLAKAFAKVGADIGADEVVDYASE